MHAALLTAPKTIEVRSLDEPSPRLGESVVRVRSVGLCGTDLKIVSGSIPVDLPRILGHEMVGEVVDGDTAGETVLVDPAVACGVCRQCREGRGNICTAGALLGRDRDGGLAELIAVPARNLHPLPSGIDVAVAPILQVLATCLHAQRLTSILPGDAVAVLGLGVTGLIHVQLARQRGARPIVGTSRSASKLEAARGFGSDVAVAASDDVVDSMRESAPDSFDLVIDCVGSIATLAHAVALARVGGRVLAYGTIEETSGVFPWYQLYFKELVLTHPRSANAEDFPVAIDLVARRAVRVELLISHRFRLDDAASAFETAGAPGAMKVVVDV
ncbi:MAG: alcohol dehydrogenase catalytic domain-containing protein [Actinomycetota bacterium]|nr:alcohol dehydrogenase catalytic domain-containing protein [Actinomycetota bacterium]